MEEGNEKVLQVFLDNGAEINTQERQVGFAFQKGFGPGTYRYHPTSST